MSTIVRLGIAAWLVVSLLLPALIASPAAAMPLRIDCPRADISVRFSQPQANATVSGLVQIEGSTVVPEFVSYRVDLSPAGRDAFGPLGPEVKQLVQNGQLAVWDSASVADGGYTLRLRAFDTARQYCEAFVTIQVNNSRPTPTVTFTPEPTDTPLPPTVPTAVPTVFVNLPTQAPSESTREAAPTRTPVPSSSGSGLLPSGLNLDSIIASITDAFRLLGRTFVFGMAVAAGIMLVVGVLFFVRRFL